MQPNSIHTQRPENERAAPSTHSMRAAPTLPTLLVMEEGVAKIPEPMIFPTLRTALACQRAAETCILERTLGMLSRSPLNDGPNHLQHPPPGWALPDVARGWRPLSPAVSHPHRRYHWTHPRPCPVWSRTYLCARMPCWCSDVGSCEIRRDGTRQLRVMGLAFESKLLLATIAEVRQARRQWYFETIELGTHAYKSHEEGKIRYLSAYNWLVVDIHTAAVGYILNDTITLRITSSAIGEESLFFSPFAGPANQTCTLRHLDHGVQRNSLYVAPKSNTKSPSKESKSM